MVIVVSNVFGCGWHRYFPVPKSQAWWYLAVCGMVWAACQRVQSVYTCLYLSELRRRTLSCVKESSVVASPLSCSPSPADSWCDVHEVPPWHLPTNKLRFFWRVVIDLLITDPFGCCGGNTKTSMKVYLIPLLMLSILVSVVDDQMMWWWSECLLIICWAV